MYEVLTIIIIIVCLLLGFIVLIQNPKGGGLSATFGQAGNQMLGAQRSGDVVEKWTWGLAIALLAFSLSTSAFIGSPQIATQPQNTLAPEADPTRATTTAPAPTLVPVEQPDAE